MVGKNFDFDSGGWMITHKKRQSLMYIETIHFRSFRKASRRIYFGYCNEFRDFSSRLYAENGRSRMKC